MSCQEGRVRSLCKRGGGLLSQLDFLLSSSSRVFSYSKLAPLHSACHVQ